MPERSKKVAPRFSAAARQRLARTLADAGLGAEAEAPITRRAERGETSPLSTGQERLWLSERVLGPSPLYHVPLAAHLVGPLDLAALERSLATLLAWHEILRACFVQEGESPRQHTLPAVELRLAPVDLTGVAAEARYGRALELARAEFRRPFDLERGPPLRAALWRLGAEEHVFLLSLHHIVCDGATMRILAEELAEFYAAEHAGRPLSLTEPELQHGDYAAWQRAREESAETRAALDYFAEHLRAPLPSLELPADRPRPPQWTSPGAWRTRSLDSELGASLAELARAHGSTPFQLFLAAFQALLARLTGQDDLVIGIPI